MCNLAFLPLYNALRMSRLPIDNRRSIIWHTFRYSCWARQVHRMLHSSIVNNRKDSSLCIYCDSTSPWNIHRWWAPPQGFIISCAPCRFVCHVLSEKMPKQCERAEKPRAMLGMRAQPTPPALGSLSLRCLAKSALFMFHFDSESRDFWSNVCVWV